MSIDTFTENFSADVLKALAAIISKRCLRGDQRLPKTVGIQGEKRLKYRLRRLWKIIRDHALRAEVIRLQNSVTRWLKDWRKEKWRGTLESLDPEDQSLCMGFKRVKRIPTQSPLLPPRGNRSLRL